MGRRCGRCVKASPAPTLVPLVEAVHEAVVGGPLRPKPRVEFYSYVSTKCTIRERDGRLHVRLSDHLHDAPDAALRGVVGILLARVRRLPESRVDHGDRAAYHAFVQRAEGRRRASRRDRGRKHIDPIGDHRSLLEAFLRVTMDLDLQLPEAPKLGWSKTRSRRRFGHQDADHGAIIISKVLDDPKVPEFVLDYVVYHELLHIVIPPRMGSGSKRIVHPKEFKQAEARFPQHAEAERWLTKLARGR